MLRSALVLKLLTYEPTGALVAAATTSLPEAIGGVRNWDYRYAWLRDSGMILHALMALDYHEEAMHFFEWLETLCLECQGELQVFLHSKLQCWVALDRAVRLHEQGVLPGDGASWRAARDEIRDAILSEGYDEQLGAFTQAFDERTLDASVLTIPLVGFLPASDPRMVSTVELIRERLTANGLVYRYLTEDGLPGGEAAFALCSLWMVDNLALSGRAEEARALFDVVSGYSNDLGLMSEEIDPLSSELRGNFPQGFTHLALIRSALHIAQAEAVVPEFQPRSPVERTSTYERAEREGEPPTPRNRRTGFRAPAHRRSAVGAVRVATASTEAQPRMSSPRAQPPALPGRLDGSWPRAWAPRRTRTAR